MRTRSSLPGALLLGVLPAMAWAQAPAGAEFQINTYTTITELSSTFPSVAMDGNGDFVVTWVSYLLDGERYGISGRRYSASGAPKGGEFQVNAYGTGDQDAPSVAADGSGNFMVVWEGPGPGDPDGVFAQPFSASGVPAGSAVLVNDFTAGFQQSPVVAENASGSFEVAWASPAQDGSGLGVFLFGIFGDFQVNTYTTGNQGHPAIAMAPSGDFVVVWQSNGQDGSGYGVFGQRFNGSGPVGSEFRINTYTTGNQMAPSVAVDAAGNFVVAWEDQSQDGYFYGIFGRRFNAAGSPQGSEFRINTYTTQAQRDPRVSADAQGNFVVVWGSNLQDGSSYGIFGQRFDAAGVKQGAEFRANTYTTHSQFSEAVASSPDGDFVVIWSSFAQAGSGSGTFGQRYGDIIFEDGFETADLSRWSSSVTDGGDLSVNAAAAMVGTGHGLRAVVNDTNSIYVQDDTPASESRYRVRFYVDTNGFDPGELSSHFRTRILIAFDHTGRRAMTVVLKRQGGAYSVEARVRRNDGTRDDTGFFPITDGPHFLEFDWTRSTGPGASNGTLGMSIDGVSATNLGGIDDDQSDVDSVRMGAIAVKPGASGTLFFDQFESRRQVFIGPE